MYNLDSVEEADLDGSWDVLFDPATPYEVGMYDSSRDSVGAALLALGYDINSNVESELDAAEQLLIDGEYYIFGEDNLKGLVIDGVLDLALVYSGDYFDELYYAEEEEIEITFGYYVPEITNIWVDEFSGRYEKGKRYTDWSESSKVWSRQLDSFNRQGKNFVDSEY